MLRSAIPSGSLELDLPAWAQGQLLPAAGSRANFSLLFAFPPAHTSSIGPLINPPRLSNFQWFLFPAGTSSAGRPPAPTSIPPSLFLLRPFSFRAGRSCRLSYLTPHLLCGWPCPWVVRNRIFLLSESEPLESWQLFRVGCPSPTLSAAPPRPAAHTAPSGPPTLSSL